MKLIKKAKDIGQLTIENALVIVILVILVIVLINKI